MSDWTDQQTVAIARRVIAEQGAGFGRLVWAAGVLSAAEYVMAAKLTEAEAAAVAHVMRGCCCASDQPETVESAS